MVNKMLDGVVLIADDDPLFRSLAAKRIEMLGARPIEATDGAEAWQILMREPVDLALIDIEMPGMTGVELIQCIRGYPGTKHLPAVMVTSISRGETIRAALAAGCTAYLTKPLQWTMFGDYVGQLLRTSRDSRKAAAELAELRRQAMALVTDCRAEALSAVQRAARRHGSPTDDSVLKPLHEEIARVIDKLQHRLGEAASSDNDAATHAA
ncbi:MAG: response regulator [Hyphomicrobiaceae bacterium]